MWKKTTTAASEAAAYKYEIFLSTLNPIKEILSQENNALVLDYILSLSYVIN